MGDFKVTYRGKQTVGRRWEAETDRPKEKNIISDKLMKAERESKRQ